MSRIPGRWRASRIALRLLAFNLLVVFVPTVGVLYLDVYEERLLEAQERSMVQQARVLAAALGDSPAVDAGATQAILDRLGRRSDARVRVFDPAGTLIADSARARDVQPADEQAPRYTPPAASARQRVLYRTGAVIARLRNGVSATLRDWMVGDPSVPPATAAGPDVELRAALAGRYGAATRPTPGQRSLTLFTAVPIRHGDAVAGAVVVSQSTFRILQALYEVRLRVFEVVVASLGAAALLTTLAAMTIVKPLRRLRGAASSLAYRRGPLPTSFPGTERGDEIGELARALDELTRRLTEHIALLEGFAADISHEFKNPLAGIRSAAETVDACEDPAERQRFLGLMLKDVERLERLVSSLRDLARIDRALEQAQPAVVDVGDLVREVSDALAVQAPGRAAVVVAPQERSCRVVGDRESLVHVFDNLLSNAVGFAGDGTAVDVRVHENGTRCVVQVADRGPGIPEAHLERVFERFFTYRPLEARREHLGLGLAIARRIVEAHGGTITAANRVGGGAVFEVRLPSARAR